MHFKAFIQYRCEHIINILKHHLQVGTTYDISDKMFSQGNLTELHIKHVPR